MIHLSRNNGLLRALPVLMLALMLTIPAALSALDPPDGGPDGAGPVTDLASSDGGAASSAGRFWDGGGSYDVIVRFKMPPVVQYRLSLQRGGVTHEGALAQASRDYRDSLEASHAEFWSALSSLFPDASRSQEYATVVNGMALRASAPALDWVDARGDVRDVELDTPVSVALADSVPHINADDLWSARNSTGSNITGKGVEVAILDTGIDYSHPDLGGNGDRTNDLANVTSGSHTRIVGGWNLISDSQDFWDGHFHGTHCAGIVGANGTVVGVAPDCDFRIYKVLSDSGSGPTSIVIKGVELATDHDEDGDTSDHSDVISMSLGGFGHPDDAKSEAVDNAMDAGAVVAVAASNDGPDYETIDSPGCARKVISVGATSKTDLLASFSSVGPTNVYQVKPDVTAPGVSIYSTSKNNGYRYAQGTSMATPHVAGAAALLLQSHPGWGSTTVKQALMATAKDVNYNAYRQGAGRIDVREANATRVVADPPSLSVGRLPTTVNTTNVTLTFNNLGTGWENGTLSWSVGYTLTSLYQATGDTTDHKSMVRANTTTVNVTAGGSFTVKLTVAYTATSKVGHYLGEVSLKTSSRTIRVPLAFYLRAAILLVDDDNTDGSSPAPYNNHNPYDTLWYRNLDTTKPIGDALHLLNQQFDVVPVRTWYDGPDKANLTNYRLVIWNTGFDYGSYGDTLTTKDQAALKDYVDGGGKVWLSGSLLLYDLYGSTNKTGLPTSDVMRSLFGLIDYTRHAGTPDPLSGTAGTFLAGEAYDVYTPGLGNVDYGANLTPADGAYQVLRGSTTDYWGVSWTNVTSAIARDSGTNRTIFTAFEVGHIRTSDDRKDLVGEVLDWIDLGPGCTFSLSGDLSEGTELSFSGRVLKPRATESYSFEWDFDYDGSAFVREATGASAVHMYPDNGNFTVALRVKEARSGITSKVATRDIVVKNNPPEAHIDVDAPGKEGSPVSFWGNATDPGGNDTFTWEWDFDYDGATFSADSTDQNSTHTYQEDGTYTAALRVTDDEGGVSPINTTQVVVENLPPTGNAFTPGNSDEGDIVQFTASWSDPGPLDTVTAHWDFEYDGATFNEMATGTPVTHTYLDDGTYEVLLRLVDDDGAITNITLQVTVRNVAPTASFVTSAPADEGEVVDLNGSAVDPGVLDVLTYEWDLDYKAPTFTVDATRQNVSNQFLKDGAYVIALRVSDGDGGTDLVTETIVINNVAPTAIIGDLDEVDEGETLQFEGSVSDPGRAFETYTYLWDFGDDGTSSEEDPSHTYLDDGVFKVTLTVTDDGGAFGSTTVNVTVDNVAPNATVKLSSTVIFENGTVRFEAQGKDPSPTDEASLTYTWNFGDGNESNGQQEVHRYLDDGVYTVTLTVQDDDGGFRTYQRDVVVNNVAPAVVASADTEYLDEGGTVNFTAVISDESPLDTHTVSWDFGDGGASDELTTSHTYLDDGNYLVELIVTDDDSGANATTFLIRVSNVRPTIDASVNVTELDEGGSISFDVAWTDPGLEDTHTVLWSFGDGTNTSAKSGTHSYPQNGTYTVQVTVTDDDGGMASKPFIVRVANVAPTAIITADVTQIEEGGSVSLTAAHTDPGTEDTYSYLWNLGDGTTSAETVLTHTYLDNDVFHVTLVVTDGDGGISTPASVNIVVNNVPPTLTASADLRETTVGNAVTFTANAEDQSPEDVVSFNWTFGDGTASDLANVAHVYLDPGTYEVTLLAEDDDKGQRLWNVTIVVKPDLDNDGIADEDDDDIDGDGTKNSEDDYPRDPTRDKNWESLYILLMLVVVVVVAVVAYVMRPKG